MTRNKYTLKKWLKLKIQTFSSKSKIILGLIIVHLYFQIITHMLIARNTHNIKVDLLQNTKRMHKVMMKLMKNNMTTKKNINTNTEDMIITITELEVAMVTAMKI